MMMTRSHDSRSESHRTRGPMPFDCGKCGHSAACLSPPAVGADGGPGHVCLSCGGVPSGAGDVLFLTHSGTSFERRALQCRPVPDHFWSLLRAPFPQHLAGLSGTPPITSWTTDRSSTSKKEKEGNYEKNERSTSGTPSGATERREQQQMDKGSQTPPHPPHWEQISRSQHRTHDVSRTTRTRNTISRLVANMLPTSNHVSPEHLVHAPFFWCPAAAPTSEVWHWISRCSTNQQKKKKHLEPKWPEMHMSIHLCCSKWICRQMCFMILSVTTGASSE